jgi:tRNA(Ile)-lysidine synthase
MKGTGVEAAVRRVLGAEGLSAPGRTVVAALSGGADSVALVSALARLAGQEGFSVVVAHLDHGLRPESAADAAFCASLCAALGLPLRSGRADVRARARREKGGLEQAARRERYAFLRAVQEETGAAAIALAHTRDDQAETVLMRLLRGSGRTGLSAMRPRSARLVRPLLGVSRRQVLSHLRARSLEWREDASNRDTTLLRNRVRHELIPYLEERYNRALRPALARTATVAAAEQDLLDGLAAEVLQRVGRPEGDAFVLERAGLAAAPDALGRLVLRRALARTGGLAGVRSVQIERLLALARTPAASGRRLALPGGRAAHVRFGALWIGPAQRAWPAFEAPLAVPGRVELPDGTCLTARAGAAGGTAVIPLPLEPLVVRTRRPGDRVQTARGPRSLKRLLLEQRVPADLRARLPLVAAGASVVWFPGLAVAAGGTGRYVALAVEPAPARRAP